MSLRDTVASLSTGTYTVTRTTAGAWDSTGHYVPHVGSPETFSIVAVEEPFDGNLQDVPEGQADNERRLIITETKLRGQRGGPPDMITIDGEPWRVDHVEVCKSFGSVHYECVVARAVRGP